MRYSIPDHFRTLSDDLVLDICRNATKEFSREERIAAALLLKERIELGFNPSLGEVNHALRAEVEALLASEQVFDAARDRVESDRLKTGEKVSMAGKGEKDLSHIGGWLFLFRLGLFFGWIWPILDTFASSRQAPNQFRTVAIIRVLIEPVLCVALGLYMGKRSSLVPRTIRIYLVVSLAVQIALAAFLVEMKNSPDGRGVMEWTVPNLLAAMTSTSSISSMLLWTPLGFGMLSGYLGLLTSWIVSLMWLVYFSQSRRVSAVYGAKHDLKG